MMLRFMPALVLALVLSGCSGGSGRPHGEPTELLQGETPLAAMCRIRAEFGALEKPLLRKVVFHEETTVLQQVEFHLHRKRLDAYYEFRLSPEADAFVKRHTRSELVASFLPLLMHPTWGGEVAVLLTGMPATSRVDAHYHFSRPSALLAGTDYRSTQDAGTWGPESALSLLRILAGTDSDRALFAPRSRDGWGALEVHTGDALEYRLHDLVRAARELSSPHHGFERIDRAEPSRGVRSWLEGNEMPPLRRDHRALFSRVGSRFALLGLFPGWLPTGSAIHELGLEAYWPLVYGYADQWAGSWNPQGIRKPLDAASKLEVSGYDDDYRSAYYRRFYEVALEACPDGPAARDHSGHGADGRLHAAMLSNPPAVGEMVDALAQGADPNRPDATGILPLCNVIARSAWTGPDTAHRKAAVYLLGAGAEPSVRCGSDASAVSATIRQRNRELLSLLYEAGARLGRSESRGQVAGDGLAAARADRDKVLVALLLEVGVHADARRSDGVTALRVAIAEEDADFVRQLLAYGADPTAFGYVEQITRLSDERNDLLEMLIEAGASANGVDGSSRPVYVAATSGRLSQTRRLLDAGANPDVMSDNGKPLLILLPLLLEPEVYYPLVDLLLDAGADPTLRDKDGRAPLSVAAARGDYELALRLKQADTAGARRELAVALAKSVSSRDAKAVVLLLGLGAHPGGMNADGMSLIEEAARRGALDVVETLLEGGASPNVSVPSGFGLVPAADIGQSAWRYPADRKSPRESLPLVTAALLAGNHEVMKRLIRYDVDVNRVTPSGLTPLLALSSARPGTVKVGTAAALLVQAGADLTATDGEGYTVLTRAAEQDRVNLLVALSEAGADLNVPDQRGRQVVEILSQRTYQTAAFGELLDLGLEPTDTATSLAKSRRAKNIVRLLERESG